MFQNLWAGPYHRTVTRLALLATESSLLLSRTMEGVTMAAQSLIKTQRQRVLFNLRVLYNTASKPVFPLA